MQAHLAATDIACRRGDRVLFRGVSLALGPGEACHVAGPNGIGKTSLIRILAGLLRPFTGSVERDGAIGLLDERHALDPQLPLGRALAFWAELDGAQLADHAERLGLDVLLDVPVRYLSTSTIPAVSSPLSGSSSSHTGARCASSRASAARLVWPVER